MKLLFFTRKIDKNDPRVGFVSDWVNALARQLDFLYVLTWQKSRGEGLAKNVKLIALPRNKIWRVIALQFKMIKYLPRVDGIFSHMMPVYTVLVGPLAKVFKKKIVHWYTHRSVDWRLKLSQFFVDEYATASSESFKMKTKKPVKVLGHGINLSNFQFSISNFQKNNKFVILSVGRISPSKNIDILIKIAEQIQLNEPELRNKVLFQIIGGPGLASQQSYYLDLIKEVKQKGLSASGGNDIVDFIGPLPPDQVVDYLQNCDLFINLSDTGSLDKAVLEAMAMGKLVLTSNQAFKNILPEQLFCSSKDVRYLIDKIKNILEMPEQEKEGRRKKLRQEVEEKHSLDRLMEKIVKLYR